MSCIFKISVKIKNKIKLQCQNKISVKKTKKNKL